jgi:CBS domain-containing protein
MPFRTVRDAMLKLEEYAVVSDEATLLDALKTLDQSQQQLSGERHPHRAVLVKNAEGRIVGKMGHAAFLKALEPQYAEMERNGSMTQGDMTGKFMSSIMDDMAVWQQDLSIYVSRAMDTKVKDVMHPVTEHVDADAPIGEAIHRLVTYQSLSLPVTSEGRVVGIVRLADVFRIVSKIIKKKAWEKEQA